MVEFGKPISISRQLLQMYQTGGEAKRNACSQLLGDIRESLWNVTVNAPDYETLQLIQAVKRLYRPDGKRLSTFQELELTRRFLKGYLHYREDDRVKAATIEVQLYNRLLQVYGLKDHQVRKTDISPRRIAFLLFMRIGMLLVALFLSLPGILLNLPIVIVADRISKSKAREALAASSVKIAGRDVLASWKLMVSLVLLPSLYLFYTFIFYWWQIQAVELKKSASYFSEAFQRSLIFLFLLLPIFSFSSVILVERGMDVVRSLSTLVLALTNPERASELRKTRRHLKKVIINVVEELGPTLFEDFYENRIIDSITASTTLKSDPPSRYAPETTGWRNTLSGIVLRTLAGFQDDTRIGISTEPIFSPSTQLTNIK